MRRRTVPAVALGLAALLSLDNAALAQGTVRAQGRDVIPTPAEQFERLGIAPLGLRDYREDMRQFVQNIADYGRRMKRTFMIVPFNGLELLVKSETEDSTRVAPARTYMRSIDGVMQDGVYYGVPEIDKPVPEERSEIFMPLLQRAKDARLPILAMDYATTPATVRDAYRKMSAEGFIPLVVPKKGRDINRLPPGASSPWAVNANSIVSLSSVRNFAVLRDTAGYGRQDQFALTMHQTNYDMLVVDVFHGRAPLTKRAVETLRYKKLGSRRLVLAQVNIGAAESHDFYWQPDWREGSPSWIKDTFAGEPDKFRVEFWRPEWQSMIFGSNQSYIYGVIDLGFDGVILDGLDAYRFFEGSGPVAEAP